MTHTYSYTMSMVVVRLVRHCKYPCLLIPVKRVCSIFSSYPVLCFNMVIQCYILILFSICNARFLVRIICKLDCPMKSFMLVATNCVKLLVSLFFMSDLILSMHTYWPEPVHMGEPLNVVPLPRNCLCEAECIESLMLNLPKFIYYYVPFASLHVSS